MLASATTTDDRGRVVDVIKPAQLVRNQSDMAAAPALGRFLQAATKAEAQRFDPARVGLGILGVIAIIAVRNGFRSAFRSAPPLVSIAVFWGGIALLVLLLRMLTRRTHGFTLSATAVSTGVCGSCGYTLDRLAPETDGCLVCPECGAAWRAFRVTRPYWSAADRAPPFRVPWWMRWIGLVPTDQQLLSRDARGAYFRIIDRRLRLMPPQQRDAIGKAGCKRLVQRIGWIGLGWRVLVSLPPIAMAMLVAWGAWNWSRGSTNPSDFYLNIFGVVVVSFLILCSIGIVRGHTFCPGDKRGAAMAAFGICGSCGQGLPNAAPDGDGCTNCTVCGAAWRVPVNLAAGLTPEGTQEGRLGDTPHL